MTPTPRRASSLWGDSPKSRTSPTSGSERPSNRLIAVLLPAVFLLNVACAMSIHAWPQFFIGRNGHIWLVAVQLAGFIGYLLYVVRFFAAVAPLIAHARAEWRESSETESEDS